ncbi:MAG: hypothetical protein ACPK85_09060 [Methanosarcina sp.]
MYVILLALRKNDWISELILFALRVLHNIPDEISRGSCAYTDHSWNKNHNAILSLTPL